MSIGNVNVPSTICKQNQNGNVFSNCSSATKHLNTIPASYNLLKLVQTNNIHYMTITELDRDIF